MPWSRRAVSVGEGADYLQLGTTLLDQGDRFGASVAYRKAAASPDSETAQLASVVLGVLYMRMGKRRRADRAWRRAKAGNPAVALIAGMLRLQAELDPHSVRIPDLGSVAALDGKDASGSGLAASGAKVAMLRAEVQDTPSSRAAAESIQRGFQCAQQGRVREACRHYEEAIDSGHPDHGPNAAEMLGMLLEESGDPERAEVAYRRAAACGHPEHTPSAAMRLGMLLADRQDMPGAIAAFQQSLDTGDPDVAPMAALALATAQAIVGDVRGARMSCGYAINHGEPDEVQRARTLLTNLADEP